MATDPSILAWRIPWTGAWWATAHGVTKSRPPLTLELTVRHQSDLDLSQL